MGAGIAKEFKKKWPNMKYFILENNKDIGDIVYYIGPKDRGIYNLITKEKSWMKPSRKDFETSLIKMREDILKRNIKNRNAPNRRRSRSTRLGHHPRIH